MFDWNDTVSFTRPSNTILSSWTSGTPTISTISEPAYLEVSAAGITRGTLLISGTDASDLPISETLSFSTSATLLSANQYKSIVTLTPSWSSYTINIYAVDIQGAPIQFETSYGPYPCSVFSDTTMNPPGGIGVPGNLKGAFWRVSIFAFEPQDGDAVVTGKGYSGIVRNTAAVPFANFPTGWIFFIEENPG